MKLEEAARGFLSAAGCVAPAALSDPDRGGADPLDRAGGEVPAPAYAAVAEILEFLRALETGAPGAPASHH